MLDVQHLSFDYPEKTLFSELCFSVRAGQIFHLLGRNGAGKTTLLKLLLGLISPVAGKISYQGKSIHQDLKAYQEELCWVGHRLGLHLFLTVKELCLFDPQWKKNKKDLPELLEIFGLTAFQDTLCRHLSEGQKRRVSLLRLLFTQAPLWFLDEPLVGLDTLSIEVLMQVFEKHLAQGGLIILSSHQSFPTQSFDYYMLSL